MPGLNTLAALSPDDWAYETLLRRRGVTSGMPSGPGVTEQDPYGRTVPVSTQPVVEPPVAQVGQPTPISTPPQPLPGTSPFPNTRTAAGDTTPPPATPPPTTPPPTTPPAGGTTQSPYGTTPITNMGSGAGGGYAYTGFDFQQDPNNRLIGKSAKYTFADATAAAEKAGAGDVWKTKEGAQYFAEKYIKPKMEAAGVEVLDIKGDKMLLRDWDDRANNRPGRWVDFVVNAGGDNPALAWQVDNSIDAMASTEQKYSSRDDAATNPYATTAAPSSTDTPDSSNTGPAEGQDDIENRKRALLARERKSRLLASLG